MLHENVFKGEDYQVLPEDYQRMLSDAEQTLAAGELDRAEEGIRSLSRYRPGLLKLDLLEAVCRYRRSGNPGELDAFFGEAIWGGVSLLVRRCHFRATDDAGGVSGGDEGEEGSRAFGGGSCRRGGSGGVAGAGAELGTGISSTGRFRRCWMISGHPLAVI